MLLGSAGAVAAVRRVPRLGLWLLTVSSTSAAARSEDLPPPERALPPAPPEIRSRRRSSAAGAPPRPRRRWPRRPAAGRHAGVHKRTRRLAMHRRRATPRRSRVEAAGRTSRPSPWRAAAAVSAPRDRDLSALGLLGDAADTARNLLGARRDRAEAPAAAPESPLARETRLLSQAYSQLRSDDDPAARSTR